MAEVSAYSVSQVHQSIFIHEASVGRPQGDKKPPLLLEIIICGASLYDGTLVAFNV